MAAVAGVMLFSTGFAAWDMALEVRVMAWESPKRRGRAESVSSFSLPDTTLSVGFSTAEKSVVAVVRGLLLDDRGLESNP